MQNITWSSGIPTANVDPHYLPPLSRCGPTYRPVLGRIHGIVQWLVGLVEGHSWGYRGQQFVDLRDLDRQTVPRLPDPLNLVLPARHPSGSCCCPLDRRTSGQSLYIQPKLISAGSLSHRMPLLKLGRMPVSALRFSIRMQARLAEATAAGRLPTVPQQRAAWP